MAIGDIVVSDNRFFAARVAAGNKSSAATGKTLNADSGKDLSKALLSCQSRIMFEIIDSEYAFGEQGKKSAVSNHYTWKVDVRLRVDDTVATLIRSFMPSPLGPTGTRKVEVQFGENTKKPSTTNPVYTGIATVGDISTLVADNDAPATERVINLTFNGSGNLLTRTSAF